MLKLSRYMKPFLFGLIMTVVLLFIQAMCDLNLPNLMSDIVNVGIQQSGIVNAAPEALSEQSMAMITAFMNDDGKKTAEDFYNLIENPDKAVYPLAAGAVYELKQTDKHQRDLLDAVFDDAAVKLLQASGNSVGGMLSDGQAGVVVTRIFYTEIGKDTTAMQQSYIVRVGLIMLLITFIAGSCAALVSYSLSRISTGFARDLRKNIFGRIQFFSHYEMDKFSTASLITRCTNDVTQMQSFMIMGVRMLCFAPIMGIGGIIMALRKAVSMGWIIALAVIVLMCLIVLAVIIAMPKFKVIQKLVDRLNLVSRENLSGLMVIRAFNTEEHEKKRFDEANKDLNTTGLFINRVMAFLMPAITLIMNGVMLLVVWVGAHEIDNAVVQVGDMMAFLQYAMQIIMSFMMFSMVFIFLPRASVSGERIAEVLKTEAKINDPEDPAEFDGKIKGLVEFKNVSFKYKGAEADAVTDISFTALPGKTTAIIGATGAGKSTLANLLLRFYDVTDGQILVDGLDIRSVKQADLREKIGYTPQKSILFSGDISSNISYGTKADEPQIKEAAEIAQAMDFIDEREEKFAAEIAQGGANVSGGQKQRLSIARSIIKKPEILLFDDSFSALDFKTDANLRKAIKQSGIDSTKIVIAQRVGTIMDAEQIIVMEDGRITGIGTHAELMRSCPVYAEIASSQLGITEDGCHA